MTVSELERSAVAPVGAVGPRPGSLPERRLRGPRLDEWAEYAIAFAAAVQLTVLLRIVLDWDDLVGSSMVVLVAFVGLHFAIVRTRSTPDVALDKVVTTVMWTVATILVAALAWMFSFVAVKGAKLLRVGFVTHDLRTTGPLEPGGGALHAIVGSVEQVGIATAIVVPIAVLTAVYLHEVKGRMSKLIRFVVDALSGLPSIVAGLLVISTWSGPSGIKASLALAILTLPIVTRASEEILRTVPDSLREASLALGAPQWKVVLRVVLPTARSGLVTATILGIARMVGETAPALYTAGYSAAMNTDPLHSQQANLPVFIFNLIRQPNQRQNDRAWAAALLLLILVTLAFAAARLVSARADRRLGRRG